MLDLRKTVPRVVVFTLALTACAGRFGAVYPPRPPETTGAPIADPTPSRINAHISVTGAALKVALDQTVPTDGDGSFNALGGDRKYHWSRDPLDVSFGQGRIGIDTHATARVDLPLTSVTLPLDLHVLAEPIMSSEYKVKLQSVDVKVTSNDRRLKVAEMVGGVMETVADQIKAKLKDFSYDLKPSLDEAFTRIAKPIDFPLADARGCAELKILGVEAGPTILADGLEKDIAIVVSPRVTLPCAPSDPNETLPTLENVATIVPGPFTVTVPIAARYDELAKAMALTFTDGKYFFSKEYPELYLSNPELYASDGALVLKLHIAGPVHKLGIDTDLDGDLFLTGHPAVIDNELQLPDLEPTIETKSLLLQIKAAVDGDKIRDDARRALRLDVSERLSDVRERLSKELTFSKGNACFHADVDKIEITGVFAHATYLRVHVAVTAHAGLNAPCNISIAEPAPQPTAPTP